MGYEVYITRKDSWIDEEGDEISLLDWQQFVSSAPDLREDGYAEMDTPFGKLRTESEGLTLWLGHSKFESQNYSVWFSYSRGNISVKNPDDETRIKMHAISQSLNARVQGEEGELYDKFGVSDWQAPKPRIEQEPTKRWWQFWK